MAIPLELPQLGNTVEECLIAKWRKRPGDVVNAGDVVADIETDKTTFELTAPASGTVLATFFEEGVLVPVFTTISVIGEPGEPVEGFKPRDAKAPTVPAAVKEAAIDRRTATTGRVPPDPTRAAYSPRASRFAATHQVDPETIVGTGPGGRVLERDVRRAYEAAMREARVASTEPLTGLRATIARRMRESLASTAQYTLHASADASGLVAVRHRFKAASEDVTIGDLVLFCTIRTLMEMPDLNVQFSDGRVVRHEHIDLAFAVDTPRGLLAPVIRHAGALTIHALAARVKELSAQAVQGTVSADDLSGGTFTVTNLGALGIESFTPLLNPPQVAILGVGAIQTRVVRKEGGGDPVRLRETSTRRAMALTDSVAFVDTIGLSLTCDHQVIDGAPAARFLQQLRDQIDRIEEWIDRVARG